MKQFALSFKKISLKLFIFLLWEERIFPQSCIVRFGNRPRSWYHPHEFIQSHVGERCFPPLPYKHCGTPFLRPIAHTAKVGGVSPRRGISSSPIPKANNKLLGKDSFLPHLSFTFCLFLFSKISKVAYGSIFSIYNTRANYRIYYYSIKMLKY